MTKGSSSVAEEQVSTVVTTFMRERVQATAMTGASNSDNTDNIKINSASSFQDQNVLKI